MSEPKLIEHESWQVVSLLDKAPAPEARALGPHLGSGSVSSSVKVEEMVNLWSQSCSYQAHSPGSKQFKWVRAQVQMCTPFEKMIHGIVCVFYPVSAAILQ